MARKKRKTCKGNFVRPTPDKAKKYLAYWRKRNILTADDIKLKTDKDTRIAQVRFREARVILNDYERRLEAYEAALAEYKVALEDWKKAAKIAKDAKLPVAAKPKRPTKPSFKSSAKDKCRAGNFKRMTVSAAKRYLRQIFKKNAEKYAKADFGALRSSVFASPVPFSYRTIAKNARVVEAVEIVGASEAALILKKAQLAAEKARAKAADAARKKAERAAAARKGKLRSLGKERSRLLTLQANYIKKSRERIAAIEKQISQLETAATAARRKKARARKAHRARAKKAHRKLRRRKSKRRNPARRRKSKRRNPSCRRKPCKRRKRCKRRKKNPAKKKSVCCKRRRKKRRRK